MNDGDETALERLAGKYIWWKSPAEAAAAPHRVIAQVMDIGDYADVQALADRFGDDRLRTCVRDAEIGQFSPRSWAYWHYRLGLAAPGEIPPLPTRRTS